jgi:hypothetical protein
MMTFWPRARGWDERDGSIILQFERVIITEVDHRSDRGQLQDSYKVTLVKVANGIEKTPNPSFRC